MWFDSPSVWSSQTWHQWWVQSCDIILTGAWWQNPSGFEQGRPSWYPTSKSLCSQTSVFLIFWIFHNLVRWNLTYIGLYGAVDEGLWSLNVVTWEGAEDTWSNASVYWVCIHSQCSSVVFVMDMKLAFALCISLRKTRDVITMGKLFKKLHRELYQVRIRVWFLVRLNLNINKKILT